MLGWGGAARPSLLLRGARQGQRACNLLPGASPVVMGWAAWLDGATGRHRGHAGAPSAEPAPPRPRGKSSSAGSLYAGWKATVLDGRAMADLWRVEVTRGVEVVRQRRGFAPGLAVIMVGDRVDSTLYVRRKQEACLGAGMGFNLAHMPETVSEEEVIAQVQEYCRDGRVDGVMVQLPLPAHINEENVMESLDPSKDVDGLHPLNMGALVMRGAAPLFEPCTPKGCIELLRRYKVDLERKKVVVLGDSNAVGLPMSLLLRNEGVWAVTLCHRADPRTPEVTRTADVLVVAVGKAELVQASWVKEGAVVLDVGINASPAAGAGAGAGAGEGEGEGGAAAGGVGARASSSHHGLCMHSEYRVVGDVHSEVAGVAGALTPVPGGVGPMTIAALLHNTLLSAEMALKRQGQGGGK